MNGDVTAPVRFLGIAGSIRRGSTNLRLLGAAARALPDRTALEVWDRLAALPPFTEDVDADPPYEVRAFRSAVLDADGLLIASPEYNLSIPGVLKNAVDWASHPVAERVLQSKPVALIGCTAEPKGGEWVLADLRRALTVAGAIVVEPDLFFTDAQREFRPDGGLGAAADLDRRLREVLSALRAEAARSRRPRVRP